MTMKQRNLTFNYLTSCLKTRLRHLARASALCEFNPDIAILIG